MLAVGLLTEHFLKSKILQFQLNLEYLKDENQSCIFDESTDLTEEDTEQKNAYNSEVS